jgi:hypothetical protein
MKRRLLIEEVESGRRDMLRPPITQAAVTKKELLAAPRFLFDMDDVGLLWKATKDESAKAMMSPPYPDLWMEFASEKMVTADLPLLIETNKNLSDNTKAHLKGVVARGIPVPVPRVCAYYSRGNSSVMLVAFMVIGDNFFEIGYLGLDGAVVHYEISQRLGIPKDAFKHTVDGTIREAVAALGMFHVRGDILHDKVELPPKVIASRTKKGKPAAGYTYIHLNHAPRPGGEAGGGSVSGVAVHLVRGHFKQRNTGTFWWRPHFAGTLPANDRKAYVVKA